MRIDGKRASEFSQDEIILMLFDGKSSNGDELSDKQKYELARTLIMRAQHKDK